MAVKIVFNETGQPSCPKCGSTSFRDKSALEWGRTRQACAGCGVGLLPASRSEVKRAKRAAAGR